MKKILILLISIAISSCDPEHARIEKKIDLLEEQTISQNTELDSIKAKLDDVNKKLDDQRIKTDSLIAYNKQLIQLITDNHNEDKGILNNIYRSITKLFE